MTMNLHSFCAELGFDAAAENVFFPHWTKICANVRAELPFYLKPEFYRKWYPAIHCPDDSVPERMDAVAKTVSESPAACFYASMLHYGLYLAEPSIPVNLPPPEKTFGENAGILALLAAMSSLPLYEKTLHGLGIPEKHLYDSARWLGGTVSIYAAGHNGIPGHSFCQADWLRHNIRGKLFRIGRLEYLLGRWSTELPAVYRHSADGKIAMFCLDGWAFDRDGFRVDPTKTEPFRVTTLSTADGKITGTPVLEDGMPRLDRIVSLPESEWSPLCSPWDVIPSVHIPGGEPMTMESVRESLVEAREFFRKYFRLDVKAFSCMSWIFDPAWETYLPDSNMAKFRRLTRPTPPYFPTNYLFFVYGKLAADPLKEPCTTSLHRAFRKRAEEGSPLRAGGMFLLPEDLEILGREIVRKNIQG